MSGLPEVPHTENYQLPPPRCRPLTSVSAVEYHITVMYVNANTYSTLVHVIKEMG